MGVESVRVTKLSPFASSKEWTLLTEGVSNTFFSSNLINALEISARYKEQILSIFDFT